MLWTPQCELRACSPLYKHHKALIGELKISRTRKKWICDWFPSTSLWSFVFSRRSFLFADVRVALLMTEGRGQFLRRLRWPRARIPEATSDLIPTVLHPVNWRRVGYISTHPTITQRDSYSSITVSLQIQCSQTVPVLYTFAKFFSSYSCTLSPRRKVMLWLTNRVYKWDLEFSDFVFWRYQRNHTVY